MATLPALLLCGHLLADFVFQTRAMVEGKRTHVRWLLAHGLEVLVVQALVLLPFCPDLALGSLAVAAVALTHVGIDRLKVVLERRQGKRLAWFAIDQALHLAVLAGITAAWPLAAGSAGQPVAERAEVSRLALVVGIYAFNVNGGSAIVSAVLVGLKKSARPGQAGDGDSGVGRLIGVLERMVMLTLVWLDQWSALGFVLTAKSIARFKELEDRAFAEAYLVGTLTSVLVAGASGLLLRQLIA
jgi:hypothetical protein